jgi:hypothetical protein
MSSSDKEQQAALQAILKRATVDYEFRQQLLSDPKRALEHYFGVVIPAGFKIRFVERDPSIDALVVLPDLLPSGSVVERAMRSDSSPSDTNHPDKK